MNLTRRFGFTPHDIARIENTFILHAQYRLGVREQKVILYLIAQLDPTREQFDERIIPVREIEAILKADGKKWGGIYREMEEFCESIISKRITFNTDVLIDGKPFKGRINWFQSVTPTYNDLGEVCIRFLFSSDLRPFLLQLKEYAQINRLEVAQMRSAYSIRLFQIFKALREKQRKHRQIVETVYEVAELKKMLLLEEQYARFNNFRQRVLEPACGEINAQTSIHVRMEFVRASTKEVSHVRFVIRDNAPKTASPDGPNEADFEEVSSRKIPKTAPKKAAAAAPKSSPKAEHAPIKLTFGPFDFAAFKSEYPDILVEITERVESHFEAFRERLQNRDLLISNTVRSQCEKWYKTFITQEIR